MSWETWRPLQQILSQLEILFSSSLLGSFTLSNLHTQIYNHSYSFIFLLLALWLRLDTERGRQEDGVVDLGVRHLTISSSSPPCFNGTPAGLSSRHTTRSTISSSTPPPWPSSTPPSAAGKRPHPDSSEEDRPRRPAPQPRLLPPLAGHPRGWRTWLVPVGIVNHDNLLLALYFALSLRAEVSVWSDAAVLEEEREVSLG